MSKIVSLFGTHSELYDRLNQRAEAYAAQHGLEYVWKPQDGFSTEGVIRDLSGADVAVIDVEPYGEEIFSALEGKTRLFIRYGVGYDKVDLRAAERHGIAVARTTAANATAVADMALAMIFAARRCLRPLRVNCMESGNWDRYVLNETVGATVGILGFGGVGRTLAKLCVGLGCRVLVYKEHANPAVAAEIGVELVGLDELFTRSDAVSIHLPYNEETHNLIDADRIALMKPSAVLVNTSRGKIVDEDALYGALKEGRIRGAGLDVFAQEPLPASSRLLELDNIILTPHAASQTEESLWNIYKTVVDIAYDFERTGDSKHILNPEFRNYLK